MTDEIATDDAISRLFEGAKTVVPAPTSDFMARLHADAEASLPPVAPPSRTSQPWSWVTGVFAASGLSGAALTGVWIGFAMPDALDTLDFSGDTSIALSAFLPATDLGAVFDE